ncbi:SETMR methyltransferase, partial [Acromyrmex insinuator]
MEKKQYRSVIRFLFSDRKTCKEIKSWMPSMGTLPSMTTVRYWFNEFKRDRSSVFDEERPGRPADVVIEEIVEKVHVSYGTVFNILHDNLRMKKLSARWVLRLFRQCTGSLLRSRHSQIGRIELRIAVTFTVLSGFSSL